MDEIDKLSEDIEREALISLHRSCPEDVGEALGLVLNDISDGVSAGAKCDPSVVINRVLGLGIKDEISPDSLLKVKDFYTSAGIEKYFLHIYPESLSENGKKVLEELGFAKSRGWMKFRRDANPIATPPTDLKVRVASPEEARHFGRIVAGAFGMTDQSAELLAGLANDPRWYLFLSYDGDEPAGAGALIVHNGCAWLEWGATDPAFRRRGSQAAVMAARINKAVELGCTHMFTETGEAVEGDPQHSYKNILKAGFKESVLRENYTLK